MVPESGDFDPSLCYLAIGRGPDGLWMHVMLGSDLLDAAAPDQEDWDGGAEDLAGDNSDAYGYLSRSSPRGTRISLLAFDPARPGQSYASWIAGVQESLGPVLDGTPYWDAVLPALERLHSFYSAFHERYTTHGDDGSADSGPDRTGDRGDGGP